MGVTGKPHEGNFWGDGKILHLVWSHCTVAFAYYNSLNSKLEIQPGLFTVSNFTLMFSIILESLTKSMVCVLEVQ